MKKQPVTVVIHIHKPEPNALELISLRQCFKVLKDHPITFAVRHDLTDVSRYESIAKEAGKADVYFERFEWDGFRGYSLLMLSPHFYKRFLAYEYILVYHLDAFVFEDRLREWCALGYDYVGTLIFNKQWVFQSPPLMRLLGMQFPDTLGNGGFSLRKTSTMYYTMRCFKFMIDAFAKRNHYVYEDIYICHNIKRLNPVLRIPKRAEMGRFGLEYAYLPDDNFANGGQQPFGCHAWHQYSPDFWKPYIRQYGHAV